MTAPSFCAAPECADWRSVPGFPGVEVSAAGELRRGGRSLRTHLSDSGYLKANVSIGGRTRALFAHVAVTVAFHGERPSRRYRASHRNGDRYDNRAENLRWRTALANEREKREHGTAPAKFSGYVPPPHVVDRAKRWTAMGYSFSAVAKALGLHRSSVSRVARGLRHATGGGGM